MEITIETKGLAKALVTLNKLIARKSTIPLLQCVKLDATASGLRLIGTDLDTWLTLDLDADVDAPGSLCVDAHGLHALIKQAKGVATLKIEDSKLIVAHGRARMAIQAHPVDDFPAPKFREQMDAALPLEIVEATRKDMLASVSHAVSTEVHRYYLNGIFMHHSATGLTFAATDGHRLARYCTTIGYTGPDVILPSGVCALWAGMAGHTAMRVLGPDDGLRLRLQGAGWQIDAKPIDGTFPHYSRVIPTRNNKRLVIDSAAFGEAVKQVSSVCTEKTRAVKLTIERDSLSVSATSPDTGTASMGVSCDYTPHKSDPQTLQIGFNAKYVLQMLKALDCERVEVMLDDAAAPTWFRDAAGKRAADFVLMPMRV